jgi:hypothetical protein
VQWPRLREQQTLQSHRDPAELARSQELCRLLVAEGYGSLPADWLGADQEAADHHGGADSPGQGAGGQLDLFG